MILNTILVQALWNRKKAFRRDNVFATQLKKRNARYKVSSINKAIHTNVVHCFKAMQ